MTPRSRARSRPLRADDERDRDLREPDRRPLRGVEADGGGDVRADDAGHERRLGRADVLELDDVDAVELLAVAPLVAEISGRSRGLPDPDAHAGTGVVSE